MVTIENQEQYLQSIKKIKQVEDETQKEIDNYKKESEIKNAKSFEKMMNDHLQSGS